MEIHMETQRFEHLDDNSAVTVHDWFRQSGGPRREQDPKRVIEGNLLEFELFGRHRRVIEQALPRPTIIGNGANWLRRDAG